MPYLFEFTRIKPYAMTATLINNDPGYADKVPSIHDLAASDTGDIFQGIPQRSPQIVPLPLVVSVDIHIASGPAKFACVEPQASTLWTDVIFLVIAVRNVDFESHFASGAHSSPWCQVIYEPPRSEWAGSRFCIDPFPTMIAQLGFWGSPHVVKSLQSSLYFVVFTLVVSTVRYQHSRT